MNKMNQVFLTFFIFLLFTSCGQEQKIEPFARPIKVNQQYDADENGLITINGQYQFDDIQIQQPVNKIPIPVLGTFVREFANTFANLFLLINQDWDVEQEAPYVEVPELDTEYIRSIQIERLNFYILPESIETSPNPFVRIYQRLVNKRAKLDFIKKIKVYMATEQMMKENKKILLADYRYNLKRLKECNKKCLEFKINEDEYLNKLNIVPIIAGQKRIYIIPELEIQSAPRVQFKIRGNIDFKVKFFLPF